MKSLRFSCQAFHGRIIVRTFSAVRSNADADGTRFREGTNDKREQHQQKEPQLHSPTNWSKMSETK